MRVHHVKYVLIGGGVASSAAAEAIREIDAEGSVLMVGQEIVRPYHRPPLSKNFLLREVSRDELFVKGQGWFEEQRIEFRSGRRAAHLDVHRGAVTLDQGEVLVYDRLLLATGMSPKHLAVPGADLPNLFYLRTLEDVHRLQTAIDKARAEGHGHDPAIPGGRRGLATVIGGGLLGVELAATLSQAQIQVDLLCSRQYPWDKLLGEIAGKALASHLESHGVRVHANAHPLRLEGDGRVQRIVLGEGRTITCDFAVAAVGAVAHKELLRGTSIAAEKAILTDPTCRTNIPNIYAAGDCAAIFDARYGKHRVVDHWEHALQSGRIAGRNMAGVLDRYEHVTRFSSQVLGLTISVWGDARFVERRLVRNGSSGSGLPQLVEIGIAADGRIAQIVALGENAHEQLFTQWVANRAQISGAHESLKDPSIPLDQLLR